jgi:hypothetical protein
VEDPCGRQLIAGKNSTKAGQDFLSGFFIVSRVIQMSPGTGMKEKEKISSNIPVSQHLGGRSN